MSRTSGSRQTGRRAVGSCVIGVARRASAAGSPRQRDDHATRPTRVVERYAGLRASSRTRVRAEVAAEARRSSAADGSWRTGRQLDLVERVVAGLVAERAVGVEVVAVPDRDLVPPPELARDAPGLDVLEPVEVGLLVALRQDPGAPVADRVDAPGPTILAVSTNHWSVSIGSITTFERSPKRLHDGLARRAARMPSSQALHRQALGVDLAIDEPRAPRAVEAAQLVGDEVDLVDVARLALAPRDRPSDGGGLLVGQRRPRASAPGCPSGVERDAVALARRPSR